MQYEVHGGKTSGERIYPRAPFFYCPHGLHPVSYTHLPHEFRTTVTPFNMQEIARALREMISEDSPNASEALLSGTREAVSVSYTHLSRRSAWNFSWVSS